MREIGENTITFITKLVGCFFLGWIALFFISAIGQGADRYVFGQSFLNKLIAFLFTGAVIYLIYKEIKGNE